MESYPNSKLISKKKWFAFYSFGFANGFPIPISWEGVLTPILGAAALYANYKFSGLFTASGHEPLIFVGGSAITLSILFVTFVRHFDVENIYK